MDFINSIIGNTIMMSGLGFVGGIVATKVIIWAYDMLKIKKAIGELAFKGGNAIANFIYQNAISKVPAGELRDKLVDTLKDADNNFDAGFNLGLEGKKI